MTLWGWTICGVTICSLLFLVFLFIMGPDWLESILVEWEFRRERRRKRETET